MAWGTETNITPGAPSASHQTAVSAVGFVEDVWGDTHYPCVTARFNFDAPYRAARGEGNVYLRYASASDWIRAQVKLRSDEMMDISVIQNSGTDLSQDPDAALNPWTQGYSSGPVPTSDPIIHDIELDGSGGWFVCGNLTGARDEFGTTHSTHPFIFHINSDGTFDSTFVVTPDATVRSMKLSGGNLYIGGDFTQVDTAGNHGGPFTRGRVAAVSPTTGEPVAGVGDFDVDNGVVNSVEVVGSDIYLGGTFTSIQSTTRNYVAKLSIAASPAVSSWNPNPDGPINVVLSDGTGLWVGGELVGSGESFGDSAGLQRFGLVSEYSNTKYINLQKSGTNTGQCYDLYLDSVTNVLYVVGDFDACDILSGFANNGPVFTRNNALAVNIDENYYSTSFLSAWNPNVDNVVWSVAGRESNIMLGGVFSTVGGTGINRLCEVDNTEGVLGEWRPDLVADSVKPVGALAFYSTANTRLVGGHFTSPRYFLAAYKSIPEAGLDVIMQRFGVPMPSNRKVSVMMELDCGEVLKTWFQDGISGKIIDYSERVVAWADDYTARVEVGPANVQGPQLDYATLESGALTCDKPTQSAFTACADTPTIITHFLTSSDHCPEAYPALIGTASYTAPRGWAEGVNGLNPPLQRPARWWHELLEPNDTINGGNAFLTDLSPAGDVTMDTWQFTNPWCLGILDIRNFQSGYLNQDDDPVSARWANILISGDIVTTGSTSLISGLSIRLDFKKNAIAVGWTTDAGVKRAASKRAYKGNDPTAIDIIYPGTFVPSFLDWQTISNLDQWTSGISLAISMDCLNALTIDMWGTNAGAVEAQICSHSVTIDPVGVDPAGLDTNLLGNFWGVFSYMEGKNLALLDDDLNSKIEWNQLTADVEAACA